MSDWLEPYGTRARPQWVILGTPTPDGRCAVYASTTLTSAELEMRAEYDEPNLYDLLVRPSLLHQECVLTVVMKSYVIVVADSYLEALQALLADWQPQHPGDSSPRAIAGA
jgi:hypothetical protein